jgi:hypothetical protein
LEGCGYPATLEKSGLRRSANAAKRFARFAGLQALAKQRDVAQNARLEAQV